MMPCSVGIHGSCTATVTPADKRRRAEQKRRASTVGSLNGSLGVESGASRRGVTSHRDLRCHPPRRRRRETISEGRGRRRRRGVQHALWRGRGSFPPDISFRQVNSSLDRGWPGWGEGETLDGCRPDPTSAQWPDIVLGTPGANRKSGTTVPLTAERSKVLKHWWPGLCCLAVSGSGGLAYRVLGCVIGPGQLG